MRKIIIAPDSFKGTMSSICVCNIIEKGILNVFPEVKTIKIPIADGGEGTVDSFLCALGGEKITVKVKGPLFDDIDAFYGILPDKTTAVIEMAAASGLPLIENRLNPLETTTYGTGQLILDALNRGCRKIIIGIGGSATNDGGIGMAAALGVKFKDALGKEVSLNAKGLSKLKKIDLSERDKRLNNCKIIAACDVDNPLYGPSGAAFVFAPQKGADEITVKILDDNLKNYSKILYKDLGIKVQNIKGSGAAGGLGAGLIAFTGAKLQSGINIILNMVKFDQIIKDADLVITGEGKIDGQSIRGKVPLGVALKAKNLQVPVIAIVGDIENDIKKVYDMGINAVFSINRKAVSFDDARKTCKEDLLNTVESLMRFVKILS